MKRLLLSILLLAASSAPGCDNAVHSAQSGCTLQCFSSAAPGASTPQVVQTVYNACSQLCAPPKPPEASELDRLKAANAELLKKLEASQQAQGQSKPEAPKP